MKFLRFLLLLPLILAPIQSKAQDIGITDSDAVAYLDARNITDTNEIWRINGWYRGLKNLNLWASTAWMASMRPQHGAVNAGSIAAMVGANATINGNVGQDANGLLFPGTTADFVSIPNPLPNPATAYTIFIAFQSDNRATISAVEALIGSYNASAAKGPSIFIHGSPQAGVQRNNVYQYYSNDGSANPSGLTSTAGLAAGKSTTHQKQIGIYSFSATRVSIRNAIDSVLETTGTYGSAWNGGASWYIGKTVDNALPYDGGVAFVAIFNKQLSNYEGVALRRLFAKTVGAGYLPESLLVVDGDSIAAGTGSWYSFRTQLWTNDFWGPFVHSRNIAIGGQLTTDVLAGQPTRLYPYYNDADIHDTMYYFVQAGANDCVTANDPEIAMKNLRAVWKAAKDRGFKVIASTVLKTGGIAASPLYLKNREYINSNIRTSSGSYDYLIDMDNIPAFANLADIYNVSTNPTGVWDPDTVHPSTFGHALIAKEIAKKIPNP